VVLYNYYFVAVAPRLQHSLDNVRTSMHYEPVTILEQRKAVFSHVVARSLATLSIAAVVVASAGTLTAPLWADGRPPFYASMTLVAVGFCLESLLVYNLVLLGRTGFAWRFSFAHMVVLVAALVAFRPSTTFYLAASAAEVAVIVVLTRACVGDWAEPEYGLFWRQATAW
jgi:hypothetical protein